MPGILKKDWAIAALIALAGAAVFGHSVWRMEHTESLRYTRYFFRAGGGIFLVIVGASMLVSQFRRKATQQTANTKRRG